MSAWDEMTYDEQRAFLGLWRPTLSFRLEVATRAFATAFAPLSAALARLQFTEAADYVLAGES